MNPHKHYKTVTILRTDGTPWVIEHVKHIIFRGEVASLYLGEHGANREVIFIPYMKIDHMRVAEEEPPK